MESAEKTIYFNILGFEPFFIIIFKFCILLLNILMANLFQNRNFFQNLKFLPNHLKFSQKNLQTIQKNISRNLSKSFSYSINSSRLDLIVIRMLTQKEFMVIVISLTGFVFYCNPLLLLLFKIFFRVI